MSTCAEISRKKVSTSCAEISRKKVGEKKRIGLPIFNENNVNCALFICGNMIIFVEI